MKRPVLILSALAASLMASAASAAVAPSPSTQPASGAEPQVRLAQNGDVEIYYDEFGRRVIVDAFTGEIIAVQRPRRSEPRVVRRLQPWEQDGVIVQGPEEQARVNRNRARERMLGRETFEDMEAIDPQQFPDAPDVYSEQPADPYAYPEESDVARRQIERRPLGRDPNPVAAEPRQAAAEPAPDATITSTTPGETLETREAIGPITPPSSTARDDVAALQVLLDRRGASPGVIDGKFGSNVDKAIAAYNKITGQNLKSTDAIGIQTALAETGGDAFTEYTITPEDAAGPYIASVPADYSEKAQLANMSFTSTAEMLAERFHMDEAYLKALNPEANFGRPGTIVKVVNIGEPVTAKVWTIVADKGRKQVRAYDDAGKLIAAYPATIGSSDTPSPSGTHAVSRIALNPEYTYNPKINFTQGENKSVLKIPPGPNGPVGSVWIALDKPTYGIHGTPDPSKIGKTESHGCVRLTNFDAEELAKIVSAGVTVEFFD